MTDTGRDGILKDKLQTEDVKVEGEMRKENPPLLQRA